MTLAGELAKVIDRAADEWCEAADLAKATLGQHIAAAVAAHMLDPATVEKAARAMWEAYRRGAPFDELKPKMLGIAMTEARAAIRAAVQGGEGG
jgi:hypothetical protein